jgi:hypothetical protein
LASSNCCGNQQTALARHAGVLIGPTLLTAGTWFIALMEPGAAHTTAMYASRRMEG